MWNLVLFKTDNLNWGTGQEIALNCQNDGWKEEIWLAELLATLDL